MKEIKGCISVLQTGPVPTSTGVPAPATGLPVSATASPAPATASPSTATASPSTATASPATDTTSPPVVPSGGIAGTADDDDTLVMAGGEAPAGQARDIEVTSGATVSRAAGVATIIGAMLMV